jgi:histidinol phosphatase-like enzyme
MPLSQFFGFRENSDSRTERFLQKMKDEGRQISQIITLQDQNKEREKRIKKYLDVLQDMLRGIRSPSTHLMESVGNTSDNLKLRIDHEKQVIVSESKDLSTAEAVLEALISSAEAELRYQKRAA